MSEMIRFKNKEEFDAHFKAMADESGDEFNDPLTLDREKDEPTFQTDVAKWWLVEISESKRFLLYLVESLNSLDYVIVDNTNQTFVCATQSLEDAGIKITALDVEI